MKLKTVYHFPSFTSLSGAPSFHFFFLNLDCEQRLKDNVAHRPGRSKQASLTPLLDPWPTLWWPRLADVKA